MASRVPAPLPVLPISGITDFFCTQRQVDTAIATLEARWPDLIARMYEREHTEEDPGGRVADDVLKVLRQVRREICGDDHRADAQLFRELQHRIRHQIALQAGAATGPA